MATIHKFMFETSFDDQLPVVPHVEDEPETELEEIEQEPVYSADDVATARQEGFDAGREEGNRQALDGIEAKLAETLDKLFAELPGLFAAHEQAVSRAHGDAIAVAEAVAAKLFPALNQKHGLDEVTAVVEQALSKLTDEPLITIRVASEIGDVLRARVEQMIQSLGFRGEIVIDGDEAIALGDCRLIWSDGSSERDAERLRAAIDEIVARHVGSPTAPSRDEAPAQDGAPAPGEAAPAAPMPDLAAESQAAESPEPEMEGTPAPAAETEAQDVSVPADGEPAPSADAAEPADTTELDTTEPEDGATEAEPAAPDNEELP